MLGLETCKKCDVAKYAHTIVHCPHFLLKRESGVAKQSHADFQLCLHRSATDNVFLYTTFAANCDYDVFLSSADEDHHCVHHYLNQPLEQPQGLYARVSNPGEHQELHRPEP